MQKLVSSKREGKKTIMKTSVCGKFEQASIKCSCQPPSSQGEKWKSLWTSEFSSHSRGHLQTGETNVYLPLTAERNLI